MGKCIRIRSILSVRKLFILFCCCCSDKFQCTSSTINKRNLLITIWESMKMETVVALFLAILAELLGCRVKMNFSILPPAFAYMDIAFL